MYLPVLLVELIRFALSSPIGFNNAVPGDGAELVASVIPSSTQEFLFLASVWVKETFWELIMFSFMLIDEGFDV